jgi:hypothetical protein
MAKSHPGSVPISEPALQRLMQRIRSEYPRSVWMLKSVMRRELGFTVRHHRSWIDAFGCPEHEYYLDFFDHALQTWFMLKYSEYVHNDQ